MSVAVTAAVWQVSANETVPIVNLPICPVTWPPPSA